MLSWAEPPSPPLTVKVTEQRSVPAAARVPPQALGGIPSAAGSESGSHSGSVVCGGRG